MPVTFSEVTQPVYEAIDAVMSAYHSDLKRYEVSIYAEMAHASEGKEFALKDRGLPVAAKIKKTSYPQRTQGMADVILTIDAEWWKAHNDAEREGMLDGYLNRLELALDAEGNGKSDDAGRPVLKNRPVDFRVEGFDLIAQRHKEAAVETVAFRNLEATMQAAFRWVDDSAEQDGMPDTIKLGEAS
jgi:hypothetical protein